MTEIEVKPGEDSKPSPGCVQVECYSGHRYAQEPRSFAWQGRRYQVAHVEQRWQAPEGPAFRVRTESGERFELWYDEAADRWLISS